MRKVKWGILGAGAIAAKVAPAIRQFDGAVLYGVGSRCMDKSTKFAEENGVENAFGSYEELCQCEDIDVIYIATPHSFHREHSLLALRNGKHVLCEKPFALNSREAEEMINEALKRGLFIMEAMWSCLMPGLAKIKEVIEEGIIGQPRFIEADFGFQGNFDPNSRLYNPLYGGGALLDVGVYPLTLGISLFGQPVSYSGHGVIGSTGVDEASNYTLLFENGVLGRLSSAISVNTSCSATIYGTEGSIHVPADFWHFNSFVVKNGVEREFDTSYDVNEYYYEVEEVCKCINEGMLESSKIPHSWTLNMMRLLDNLRSQMGVTYPSEVMNN